MPINIYSVHLAHNIRISLAQLKKKLHPDFAPLNLECKLAILNWF